MGIKFSVHHLLGSGHDSGATLSIEQAEVHICAG
jgi:hypothetical protein